MKKTRNKKIKSSSAKHVIEVHHFAKNMQKINAKPVINAQRF